MNKKGYTILEVTLFMAISAILALAAFAGLGPRLRNVRFTDSVRSLESSINAQFNNAQTGSNARTTPISCALSAGVLSVSTGVSQPGSAESCVVNGLVAVFDNTNQEVKYRKVVSLRESISGCTETELFKKLAQCHRARVLGDSPETQSSYKYSNGLKQESGKIAYGYAQDPNGSDKVIFNYSSLTPEYAVGLGNTLVAFRTGNNQFIERCFKLDNRDATFKFSNSSLKPVVMVGECRNT